MKKIDRLFYPVDLVFRGLYLILVFISFCGFLAGREIVSTFAICVLPFAALSIGYKILHYKRYYANRYSILLALFIGSYAFSTLMNRGYGLGGNIKALIWLILLFAGLGSLDIKQDIQKVSRYIEKFCFFFLGLNFIMLAISMYYLLTVKGEFYYIDYANKVVNFIGMMWGRLWGIYTDPNYGSTLQVVAVILILYFLPKTTKKYLKIFYYLELLMAVLYYAYADSRTAFVAAISGGFVYVLLTYKKAMGQLIRHFALIFCVIYTIGNIAPQVIHLYMNSFAYTQIANVEKKESKDRIKSFQKEQALREQDIQEDVSNRRFELWKSSLEISKTSPIWGVTHRNIIPYAKANLPDTYMVSNNLSHFSSSHNLVFDVLMSQGIIGLGLFGLMGLIFVIDLIRLRQKDMLDKRTRIFVAAIGALFASALFIPDIVYVNSIGSYMAWTLMGYVIYYIQMKLGKRKGK